MTYELIIEIALKSFVTSGIALLLLALLKERSAGERSWIAHIGLAATLILPLAAIFMPKWYVESPAPAAQPLIAASPDAAAPAPAIPSAAVPIEPAISIDFGSIVFWFYALVAAALLLVTLLAIIRLFVLRGRAAVLVEPKWLSALAHAQRRMGFKHGTALLVSDALGSPVSWGVLRPIILLNAEAVNSAAEAEAIIAHELAHVAHFDWAKLLVARAATALFWFNPLVWLLARQCHQLREEAADDAVLLSDVPSTDYAALLIGAARHDSKGTLLAANGVAPGRGSLKRRVTRVLDAGLQRAPARMSWGAACTLAGLAVAAPLSAVTAVTPPASSASGVVPPAARPAPLALVAEAAASSAEAIATAALAAPQSEAAPIAPPAPAPVQIAAVPAAEAKAATRTIAQQGGPATIEAVVEGAVAVAMAQAEQTLRPEPLAEARTRVHEKQKSVEKTSVKGIPSPEQLIAMRVHGISADKVRRLAEAGYPNLSHGELMSASIHGVTPDYINELAQAGYRGLSMSQLTSMRIHRVTPGFIRGLAEAGYPRLSHNDLISAAIHRVTPEFVRDMARAGYSGLSMDQLTAMRIHGVSPAFVQEMRSLGHDRLPPRQLIDMRAHGVDGREHSRDRRILFRGPAAAAPPGPPPPLPPKTPLPPTE